MSGNFSYILAYYCPFFDTWRGLDKEAFDSIFFYFIGSDPSFSYFVLKLLKNSLVFLRKFVDGDDLFGGIVKSDHFLRIVQLVFTEYQFLSF